MTKQILGVLLRAGAVIAVPAAQAEPMTIKLKPRAHRRTLALAEIDSLAANLIHDAHALDARLERAGLGPAVIGYPDLRLIEAGAECIRHELEEARATTAWRRWLIALGGLLGAHMTSTRAAA